MRLRAEITIADTPARNLIHLPTGQQHPRKMTMSRAPSGARQIVYLYVNYVTDQSCQRRVLSLQGLQNESPGRQAIPSGKRTRLWHVSAPPKTGLIPSPANRSPLTSGQSSVGWSEDTGAFASPRTELSEVAGTGSVIRPSGFNKETMLPLPT